MENWYKQLKLADSPLIAPVSRNSYGEATVYIKGKEYHYRYVPEPAWSQLVALVKHKNWGSAFPMLQSLELDPYYHPQATKEEPKQKIERKPQQEDKDKPQQLTLF